MQTQPGTYDCALGKEELKPLYSTLIALNLIQINKPD
jgi:hypothetical protein